MTAWPWRSPQATRQGLSDRIAARYEQPQRARRMQEIAYRRLLARIFATHPEHWVVKGGAALLLRLDPNRTSNDIDLTYVHEAEEHAVALTALRAAAAVNLGDFFAFDVGTGIVIDSEHPLERSLAVPIVARIGPTVFAEFSIDLALPRDDLEPDWLDNQPPLTGVAAVDELPRIAVLSIPAQIADKTCALFERHGPNNSVSTRARDLADIAMIASQLDVDAATLEARLRREEQRRLEAGTLIEPLPAAFALAVEQHHDWSQPRRWQRATRDAPVTFDEAAELAARLLDPMLAGRSTGRWASSEGAWRGPETS